MANNNKHTGPNVPALRFPEFSGEWTKIKLRDLGSFFSGGTPSSSRKDYYGGEIPFIRSGELHSDSTALSITKEAYDSCSAKMVNKGDLLLALYGATSGDISISRICGAINQAILCIRPQYMDAYFIKSLWEKHKKHILETYLQGGQGNLSSEIIKNISFFFPNSDEQVKISRLIHIIDDRIETQSKIIEELTTLRSALLEKVFQVSNPTLEVGAIAHQTSERNKLCRYSNVLSVSNRFGFINQSEQFEDRNVASDDVRNYKVVHRGDFAYNPARINVGSIAMLKSFESGIVSPMYICFQVDDTIVDPSFFELFLETKAFKDEVEIRLEGSVRRCLSFEALCEIHLPRPALLVQRSISDKIGNISSKIKLENRILRAYIRQKEWLLKQMFI